MIQHIVIKSVGVAVVTLAGIVLDEKTAVPVITAVVVAAAWGRAQFWLGKKLQSLEDGLKVALDDRAEAKEVMRKLVSKVESLPCDGGQCEPHKKRKVDRGE